MSDTRTYPSGVPCWIDIEQPDPAAARSFYGGLLGWSFTELTGDGGDTYIVADRDGLDVAALAPAADGPARWNTYIAVTDAGAAADAVRSAGGTVTVDPVRVGPAGTMAVCADPQGAIFRLWQPAGRPGAQLVNAPGGWNFSDLRTSDAEAALSFYTAVFGWEGRKLAMPGGRTMLRVEGYGDHLAATADPDIYRRQAAVHTPDGFADAIAGLGPTDAGEAARWAVTISVADRDEAVGRARDLGAEVLASEETRWARTARIRDPQGAELSLSQFTPPDD